MFHSDTSALKIEEADQQLAKCSTGAERQAWLDLIPLADESNALINDNNLGAVYMVPLIEKVQVKYCELIKIYEDEDNCCKLRIFNKKLVPMIKDLKKIAACDELTSEQFLNYYSKKEKVLYSLLDC